MSEKKSGDTKVRILSGVVAAIIFIGIFLAPDIVFHLAFVFLAGALTFEATRAFSFDKLLMVVCCVFAVALSALSIFFPDYLLGGIFLFVVIFLFCLLSNPEKYNIQHMLAGSFTILYVCVFTSFMPRILQMGQYGKLTLLFVFICAWLSDIGAYTVGRLFGKHKLIPKVSPKKTVEGAVGGVVSAILFSLLYAFCLQQFAHITPQYVLIGIFSLIAAILGQMGDLLASMIKRYCGIKDFGKIMPGHGGLFDRCDSIILIAPLLYYGICIFGNFLS